MTIPSIGAYSSLVPTGIRSDGTIDVPPVEQPEQASFYQYGPQPGQRGPAIILGHINGGGRPGVFAKLPELNVDDEIKIDTTAGPISYRVYRVDVPLKAEFPWKDVIAPTEGSELRLITCTGRFVGGPEGYNRNAIVYARLA